jgi:hypothetical protein
MDLPVYLYSFFGPFLVWPLEYLLPFPFIIEELFKGVLVYIFHKQSAGTFFLCGITFALTETFLYSINIFSYGSFAMFAERLVLTSALHSATFLIIYGFTKIDRRLLIVGLAVAMVIHFFYNSIAPTF